MKNKLFFLTENSLNRKIKTKWFLIANIIIGLIVVAGLNIDSIINFFGGDFNEKTQIYVVDNTGYTYDILKQSIDTTTKDIEEVSFKIKKETKKVSELKKNLKDKEIIIEINENKDNFIEANMVSEGYIDTIDYQVLASSLNNTKISVAMIKSNIDPSLLNNIYKNIEIKREYLDETKKSEDESMEMIMSTVFPVIILPFFMLSIFLVQTIGSEINDEKTTRGMEIIISNVSAKTHFFSKILAGNLFVIIQGALLFLYAGLGFFIRKVLINSSLTGGFEKQIGDIIRSVSGTDFASKLIYIIPITLILMLLTFVAYSLLAGILAAMTTNSEDFGQMQTPIIIISLLGYYLSIMAGMFKGALFIRVLSYVPFISAVLSPSLLILGQIGIVDVLISILITIITNYLLIKYGIRVYKEGILNYSSKDLWKKFFKALKS